MKTFATTFRFLFALEIALIISSEKSTEEKSVKGEGETQSEWDK